jgi:hypothetical protein
MSGLGLPDVPEGLFTSKRRVAVYTVAWCLGYLLQNQAAKIAIRLAPAGKPFDVVEINQPQPFDLSDTADLADAAEIDPATLKDRTAFKPCAVCDHEHWQHRGQGVARDVGCRQCDCHGFVQLADDTDAVDGA